MIKTPVPFSLNLNSTLRHCQMSFMVPASLSAHVSELSAITKMIVRHATLVATLSRYPDQTSRTYFAAKEKRRKASQSPKPVWQDPAGWHFEDIYKIALWIPWIGSLWLKSSKQNLSLSTPCRRRFPGPEDAARGGHRHRRRSSA